MQDLSNLGVEWSVFSQEEQDNIKKVLSMLEGKDSLAAVINEMNPAKERELQKIIDALQTPSDFGESDVLREYSKKNPDGPKSPEEEKEIQAALDAEVLARQAKHKQQSDERLHIPVEIAPLPSPEPAPSPVEPINSPEVEAPETAPEGKKRGRPAKK